MILIKKQEIFVQMAIIACFKTTKVIIFEIFKTIGFTKNVFVMITFMINFMMYHLIADKIILSFMIFIMIPILIK